MQQANDTELDLELLRVLDVMHRERHVTRAALHVGLSQPAMSRALGRLRSVFHDELFVRTRRGMIPTPRADELAPAARNILESANAMKQPAQFDPSTLVRTFTLASADYLDMQLLPAITHALSRAPGISLLLRPFDWRTAEQLATGAMDLYVGTRALAPSDTIVRLLYEEQFVCAVRRGHPRVKKNLTLAMFLELSHLLISPSGDTAGGAVDHALAAKGLERRIAVRTHSFNSAPLIVAKTDLILTAPRRLLEADAKRLNLRLFAPPIRLSPFELVLAWHPRVQRDSAHVWFRDLVAKTLTT